MTGLTPAIILSNPKWYRNLAAVVRAAACFDIGQVWYTGNRIEFPERTPRELRMPEYRSVELIQHDHPFDRYDYGCTPVAIELREDSQMMTDFVWPDFPVLVFGPEDGSVPPKLMKFCQAVVAIPSKFCMNLAGAVYTSLYDFRSKRQRSGVDDYQLASTMLNWEEDE